MAELLQFAFSGLTVGAIYALVALGFTLIYNASDIINFAQGEFVMLGGMTTVFLALAGVPLPLAALIAIAVTTGVGLALHRFAIEPARGSAPRYSCAAFPRSCSISASIVCLRSSAPIQSTSAARRYCRRALPFWREPLSSWFCSGCSSNALCLARR